MRLLILIILIAVIVVTPLVLLGNEISLDKDFFRGFGNWAWLAAFALLIADLLLPIPSTVIISSMGIIYGPLLGGLIGSLGSICSGLISYAGARCCGKNLSARLLRQDQAVLAEFFRQHGSIAIAVSRWIPIVSETVTCLAGLSPLPFRQVFIALSIGSIPMAFCYAALGMWMSEPMALVMSAIAPLPIIVIWRLSSNSLFPWSPPANPAAPKVS